MTNSTDYHPATYFGMTLSITTVLWLTAAVMVNQTGITATPVVLLLLGLATPFLVALWMTYRSPSVEVKRQFTRRLTRLHIIRPKLLPVIILLMPAVIVVSALISLLVGESVDQFVFSDRFSFSMGMMPVLLILILAACFEELGWRGYGFESLESRFNFVRASLIFSVLWSAWHLPLVFIEGTYQYEVVHESIWFGLNFFVSIIPMGVIVSWICKHNGGSIIAAILFHFMINISQEALEITQITKSIETLVLTAIAAWLLYRSTQQANDHVSDSDSNTFTG